jgi:Trypsin
MARRSARQIGKRLIVASMILAGLVFPAAAGAITYGEPDGEGHPNVGALVVSLDSGNVEVCSGTLIAPTVFLTASHCTAFVEGLGLPAGVTFDSVLNPGAPAIPGVMHTNPDFKLTGGKQKDPADVAVVTLAQAPAGISPASLPPVGELDSLGKAGLRTQAFTAVGYGARERVKLGPGAPQFGPSGTRYVSESSFRALRGSYLNLSQNPTLGDGGTCFGDSGGPNFLGSSDVIAAITITGDAVCRATNVTLRLDRRSVQAFLDDFVDLPD